MSQSYNIYQICCDHGKNFCQHKLHKFEIQKYRNEAPPISRPEHLNKSGIISDATDFFLVKPITADHDIPKISTRLTIFWVSILKTEFVKTIYKQERASSVKKSDRFHKKFSMELRTILMFELLLCWNKHSISYWKSTVKHCWF